MPKFDIFKLQLAETPNGFCPMICNAEKKFLSDKFERIETQRKIENEKSRQRHLEYDRDCEPCMNNQLLEPIPNPSHPYCQICNQNYLDFG